MPTPKEGYFLKDGTEVFGTTTILGRFKESGGLLQWAFKVGKSGARHLYEKRDQAGEIGTQVHAQIEAQLHGQSPPDFPSSFTEEMRQQTANSYENYMREMRESKGFIMPWEAPLVSEQYKYGGTPDGLIEFEEKIYVADWKSGKGPFVDHVLQAAAYRQLLREVRGLEIAGARIYLFSKESGRCSKHSFETEILDLAFEQFVALVPCFARDKKLSALL